MQWLKLVSEDAGVQRLREANRQRPPARSVDAVSPYPASHATQIGDRQPTRNGATRDRRSGDRRSGEDRRKQQVPVLLDTRSRHDRRGIENRRAAGADSGQQVRRRRINLYA